jgi:hypothetical protein
MVTRRSVHVVSTLLPVVVCAMSLSVTRVGAQGLGGAGTIQGIVKDPTGGVMQAVVVRITNPVTGFTRTATTDTVGKYVFTNLPPNPYRLIVEAQGFQQLERDVDVRSGVPITLDVTLALAGTTASVEVTGRAEDLLERDPSAHTDIDQSLIGKLLLESSAGLNQIVTLASPGVVSDSNGFFHPLGDHAQTQFSIDNQPIADQQSRLYSNQISQDAVESLEVITGVAPAEYGDKTSLVVHIVTKSGLDQAKPTGAVTFGYSSFSSPTIDLNVGAGTHGVGNFLSVSGMRTDRFLDPPEFQAIHDSGNQASLFDRLDVRKGMGTFHLNVQVARSAFDVPNDLDAQAAGQAQHQQINTFNIAPGYSTVIGSNSLFTANAYVRQDHLTYTPSPDPFADLPGTASQDRKLTNLGFKADLAYTAGNHNVKVGGVIAATKLDERFTLGFTDPTFNSPCLDVNGNPSGDTTLTSPDQCAGALTANSSFDPHLFAFDLTRGGSLFHYSQAGTIKQQAAYVQDEIKAGNATFKLGVRLDHYDGLSTATQLEPRLGASYAVPASHTVLRASYGRTMETPYNENLLLSSGVGAEALTGTATPPPPGTRNQVELGVQQGIGRWVVADFGYFNKHTTNGYDFNVLFNTPIVFPVAWDHSRIDGFTGRVNLVEHGGFSAFFVMAHTNAIYFPPGVGGVLLAPPCTDPGCSFRIDHDQKFNSTTNLQYVLNRQTGTWIALNWRYDSGLVASSIGDVLDLINKLTPAQQAAAGVSCGGVAATAAAGFTDCAPGSISASRLVVPAAGTGDPLNNPARVAPRHLFDLGVGTDNLLRGDKLKVRVRFSVINLTNKDALYNFLSTFSGTHFVTPRAYQVHVGVLF